MSQSHESELAAGQRGPPDHLIREQIITAAAEHFGHYGYSKTTVSDLAKAIGFSKAYIYKFFDSKQSIGEEICSDCVGRITTAAQAAILNAPTATEKYRRFFRAIVETGAAQLNNHRRLHEMSVTATLEKWSSIDLLSNALRDMLREIILFGRESGEFERKTPLDETCRAILQVMQPFTNPLMLEANIERVPEAPNEIANLVLRSLAP